MTPAPLPSLARASARLALFAAEHFPTVDAPQIPSAVLELALAGLPVDRARTPEELEATLAAPNTRVLVLPHGSAFPVVAWPAIARFLRRGGGLCVLGGAPFHQPVRRDAANGKWILSPRQPTYARELLIGPAEHWQRTPESSYSTTLVPATGFSESFPETNSVWSLTVRLATKKDTPDDDGTAGPRDAVVRPLVHVVDAAGLARGCPLLEIDRLRGDEAGARWVFAPCDAALPAPVIRALVERALDGAAELYAVPVRASVEPGESVTMRVTRRRPRPHSDEAPSQAARLRVTDDAGETVFSGDVKLSGLTETMTGLCTLRPARALAPGLYHVAVDFPDAACEPRHIDTGFWVKDTALLASAPVLTASHDWLRKDGAVFPIIGTTYMASDVHRKFLFEPNPHVWDRDFAEMKRQGVNFVRTGLWTAWGRAMLDPGAIDEGVLLALDAYVLTAAKHGILLCFNFFAFLPPAYSADNPYLDPRALEGQRELLTLFASRFARVGWVHWDLINEPSYAPRAQLWRTRAIGDAHERRAFEAWVRARHGDDVAIVAERWRDPDVTRATLGSPPHDDEFGHLVVRDGRCPRKVRDFREYTQDAVARWARTLRDVLRAAGDNPLVTLGQDEGGTGDRPTQQLMGEFLDYTAVHTWWNNDDLLWDGVVTKLPERASVHQETGLMRLEDIDGTPWRSPETAALVLERKVAYAFAARGAGVIEWAWNINPYQPIDNESVIGLIRPDGTAKPELAALGDAAAFFAQAAPLLDDFEPDPVVMLIPHARQFLGRPHGIDATKVVVRTLAERFGVVPTALSDLNVDEKHLIGRKLVIVPAVEVLDERAARALLAAARSGTRLLVTGAISGDSYGGQPRALLELGVLGPSRPIAFHERSRWSPEGPISFEGLMTENIERSLKPEPAGFIANVWHEPLPLEFARQREPLVRLLEAALRAAAVPIDPCSGTPIASRVLYAPRVALLVVVNETAEDAVRRVCVDGLSLDVPVRAFGARMGLVDRRNGELIAATAGAAVSRAAATRTGAR
jgi:hypothetical protein